jgi:hypothetical protein
MEWFSCNWAGHRSITAGGSSSRSSSSRAASHGKLSDMARIVPKLVRAIKSLVSLICTTHVPVRLLSGRTQVRVLPGSATAAASGQQLRLCVSSAATGTASPGCGRGRFHGRVWSWSVPPDPRESFGCCLIGTPISIAKSDAYHRDLSSTAETNAARRSGGLPQPTGSSGADMWSTNSNSASLGSQWRGLRFRCFDFRGSRSHWFSGWECVRWLRQMFI